METGPLAKKCIIASRGMQQLERAALKYRSEFRVSEAYVILRHDLSLCVIFGVYIQRRLRPANLRSCSTAHIKLIIKTVWIMNEETGEIFFFSGTQHILFILFFCCAAAGRIIKINTFGCVAMRPIYNVLYMHSAYINLCKH